MKIKTKQKFKIKIKIDNQARRNFYHNIAYQSSDIDLFIYGLNTQEEANKKLEEIYQAVSEAIPAHTICFRYKKGG